MRTITREEFFEEIKDGILAYMPEGNGWKVDIRETLKNNDQILHALNITREGQSVVPNLYLEPFFEKVEKGEDLENVCVEVASTYTRALQAGPSVSVPDLDFDAVKDQLRVHVVEASRNEKMLRNMLYRSLGNGFVMTAHINLPEVGEGSGSIRVTRELAMSLGWKTSEIWEEAMKNTMEKEPATLSDLHRMLMGIMNDRKDPDTFLTEDTEIDPSEELLVLTNPSRMFGAMTLFYPETQERIAAAVGGDYFVLPSSIHEVLIVRDNGKITAEDLVQMVREVNATQVAPEEVLADKVLRYDRKEKTLSIAAEQTPEREKDVREER